jgi:hypothetical protein
MGSYKIRKIIGLMCILSNSFLSLSLNVFVFVTDDLRYWRLQDLLWRKARIDWTNWPLKLPALGRYLNILIDRYRVASQVCGVRLVIKSCMTLITRLPRSLHIVSEYIYYNRMSCTFLLSINKGTLLNASRLWNCYQVSTVLLSFFFSFFFFFTERYLIIIACVATKTTTNHRSRKKSAWTHVL